MSLILTFKLLLHIFLLPRVLASHHHLPLLPLLRSGNEGNEAQASDALDLSLPTPRINVIDCSMSNAWFPGQLDGVSFSKFSTPVTGNGKRDKIICDVDFQAPDNTVLVLVLEMF
jgi:hypothetical protein